ncbi:TIGR03620 family F420-dependent LLM class oxidoreductase [Frankia sp. AgB1.9]|uniref:TIGR03620 family F420-dependent LLM class oxidoreductase n=1 Tax=unclassified Frankia TaxID=2632575 RepID=UPI0019343346|nr:MULTISPECIES: TIGR03620 family F420-dependent LLM class oxidoreductase [unclassified Frankia]MBL7494079.1 TIGR03620 family F420-dependent LLM class oxidoreductase [Frankia sp. AgW1.1]MBL7548582.1 TIGR03620 family F420-dependent LLM class oxidoreductase [Frankia sp. AgB1.9]MBL7622352.1 TIGR03620 family F420-dependent LLM class oxidoreductase [Frankia sp. AgB1.8]
MKLDGVGIWSMQLRFGDPGAAAAAAAELDELGYRALWIPDMGGPLFDALEHLLGATRRAVIATGILNLWMHEPADVAAGRAALVEKFGERLLLGIGVSHAPLIDQQEQGRYRQPLRAMAGFLDALDAAAPPVPVADRVLAALGPKMLELARTRAGGAHPYLVTPEHTAAARAALGAGPLLAPEQTVVLTEDRAAGLPIARKFLAGYLQLPNYANSLRRLGFTDDDVTEVSDRIVDATIAVGDEAAIAQRVREHQAAGADHVCVQVINADNSFPTEAWRRLAPALLG